MSASAILDEIRPLGAENYKKILANHGVQEPCFGVKVEELKKIQKRIKKDYQLALDLYETGVYDAMYLAGLIADDLKMTKADLNRWAKGANCSALSEYTVPWVAAGGRFGPEMAREWIGSKKEGIASSGWSTVSNLVALRPDAELDLDWLKSLLSQVETSVHDQQNRVSYVMNGFVIAVGAYVVPLGETAFKVAQAIGPVTVNMGNTECKVPLATDYILKVRDRGTVGKKKKTVKC